MADQQPPSPLAQASVAPAQPEPTKKRVAWLSRARILHGDNLVLQDVELSIYPGDFIYLVGRVGSGKSSLIATLTGQIPLQAGQGCVCGFDLETLKRNQIPLLRRSLGVVFQDFKLLLDRSVEKNLLFVLRATGWKDKQAIADRIAQVLDMVGMRHKAFKMPNQLSGGEQQRVAIARALLNEPQLILADEPTGNLDPDTSEGILLLLQGLAKKGKSVLMATHNFSLVNNYPATTYQCKNLHLSPRAASVSLDLQDLFDA